MRLLRENSGSIGRASATLAAACVCVIVALGACSSADESAGDEADGTTATTAADDSAGPAGSEELDAPISDPAGSIDELEEPADGPGEVEPVELDQDAPFGDGVVARVVGIESTEVTPALPGEIGGPAVLIDVEVSNGSDADISLDAVTVDLVDLTGAPLLPVTTEPADPLAGELEPGASRAGRYVFSVPVDDRDDVRLTIKYSGDAPAVVLTGSLPND